MFGYFLLRFSFSIRFGLTWLLHLFNDGSSTSTHVLVLYNASICPQSIKTYHPFCLICVRLRYYVCYTFLLKKCLQLLAVQRSFVIGKSTKADLIP